MAPSLVVGYDSSDDESPAATTTQRNIDPAPSMLAVAVLDRATDNLASPYAIPPSAGKKVPTGTYESVALSDNTFRTYHRQIAARNDVRDGDRPRKRQKKGDTSVVYGENSYKGPWGRWEIAAPEAAASDEEYEEVELDGDEEEAAVVPAQPMPKASTAYQDDAEATETSTFHAEARGEYDYQGRTYIHVPQDLDIDLRAEPGSQQCFVPKKIIHRYGDAAAHKKAITSLNFFPRSGHIFMSSSADSTVKIWSMYHGRELLRTMNGHTKAITDATFRPDDGLQALTGSFDRQMKLWDTETGKCHGKYSTGKTPNVVRWNPTQPHLFLAGMSDSKIVEFDTRSGEQIQTYEHHLQAVNSLTFVDGAQRFLSTADDRSLRSWEHSIPVPTRTISEPYMFSLTRACTHPNGKNVAYQSSDNQIVVFNTGDRVKQNRKKSYRGHTSSGMAVGLSISADGQWLVSGSQTGEAVIWDWKTCKMMAKVEVSKNPLLCVDWSPQETSKVICGDNDGKISLLD